MSRVVDTASFSSGTATVDLNFLVTASAVPEPSAWGLMILGFGTVGAALRGRTGRLGHAALA